MIWITPRDLQAKIQENENVLIVDVREKYEQEICQIPSIHIPMAEMAKRFHEIPADKTIVVMCRSGKRAEALANLMECELKFSNLYVLEGGILKWIEDIDPKLESY